MYQPCGADPCFISETGTAGKRHSPNAQIQRIEPVHLTRAHAGYRHGISSQSCLCSSPVFRSFHMGIASSTSSSSFFSPLSHPLEKLMRGIRHHFYGKVRTDDGACASAPRPSLTSAPPRALHDSNGVSIADLSVSPPKERRSRGNWPFIAEVPSCAPQSERPPFAGHRDAHLACGATHVASRRSAKVLRRASDSGTCRLVIAGRMADVCAELERLAANEALQAYRVACIGTVTVTVTNSAH